MIQQFDNFWWQLKGTDIIVEDRIRSITINEEMDGMDTCQVSMLDPYHMYSRIFRSGRPFSVNWGNLTDKRGETQFFVNSPSGSASENGEITYNMRGQSFGQDMSRRRFFNTTTKGAVVASVLKEMNIVDAEIDFERMSDSVTNDTQIGQWENNFRFLNRLAREWRCVFRVGTTKANQKCAVFCEPNKLDKKMFAKKIAYTACTLEYGGGLANVISYDWQDESMNSAFGAGTSFRYVNGEPQMYKYVVEDQSVLMYKLNPEAVEAEYNSQKTFTDKTNFMIEIMNTKSFEEVKRFFILDCVTTAPQGTGVSVKVHMFGDINITAGQKVNFGGGFPDLIGTKDSLWYVQSVSHSMSGSGYFCDLEIVDSFRLMMKTGGVV